MPVAEATVGRGSHTSRAAGARETPVVSRASRYARESVAILAGPAIRTAAILVIVIIIIVIVIVAILA
jgi:hypothetical protein